MERKKVKKNKQRLRDMWDTIKCTNADKMGVPERKEREKEQKNYLKKKQLDTFQISRNT